MRPKLSISTHVMRQATPCAGPRQPRNCNFLPTANHHELTRQPGECGQSSYFHLLAHFPAASWKSPMPATEARIMSYEQLEWSWSSRTHTPRARSPISRPPTSRGWSAPLVGAQDIEFIRFRLVYDSGPNSSNSINWNKVLGLVMTTAISASFWTSVGFLVSRFWK